MTTGDRATSLRPAGWYTDPEDATRLRKWDGRGWTDETTTASGAPATASTPAASTRGVQPPAARFGAAATPAGWHPDPADRGRARYWDGARWTDRIRNGPVHPLRPALGDGFFTLSRWVRGLLVASGVLGGVLGLGAVWSYRVLDGWLDGSSFDEGDGTRLDLVTAVDSFATLAALAVTGVVFLVWLDRAYRCDRVDPSRLKRGRGWAIGSWFVPFAAFVVPRRVMKDLWNGARAGTASEQGDRLRWWLPLWWLCFVAMIVGSNYSSRIYLGADPEADPVTAIEQLRLSAAIDIGVALLTIVAAGLAVVVVREVTDALRRPESLDPLPEAPAT